MWRLFLVLDHKTGGATGAQKKTTEELIRHTLIALSLTIVLTILLPLDGYSQSNISVKGKIYNSNSIPIPGAEVELAGTGYRTVTDDFGIYRLENIPPGSYKIVASANGYEQKGIPDIEVKPDINQSVNIFLEPRLQYLDKIVVYEKRSPVNSDEVEVILREDIKQSGVANLPQLLEDVRGIFIQKSSGSGGQSQIRIRGSDPKQVLVLIDGQKINPSGSGVTDLNSIPLEMIERVEVYKGGASSEFGPDALGGVINIITHRNAVSERLNINAERDWGSWSTETDRFSLSDFIPSDKFTCRLSYTSSQSVGDYDFAYKVEPGDTILTGTRVNNKTESYNFFTSGTYHFNDKFNVAYSGQYYHSENGLPGSARSQSGTASARDDRRLLNTAVRYKPTPDHDYKFDFGFSSFEQEFRDLDAILKYHAIFKNNIYSIRHSQNHVLMEGNRLRFGTEFRHDILDHTDLQISAMSMGEPTRDGYGIFLSDEQRIDISKLIFADVIALDGGVRFDYSKTYKDSTSWQDTVRTNDVESWSPKIGAVISKGDRYSYIIRGSYGKSLRLPSMNALFWKGDTRSSGNPGLKPERSEHSEAGIELSGVLGPVRLSGGIIYFHSFVQDLVSWVPSAGAWRPENVDKAQITGHEDFIEAEFFNRLIFIQYQNTITTALNKSSDDHTAYNQRLVFTPHYITSISTGLNLDFLTLGYTIRLVDSAYTLKSNTKYYPSYRVDDLRAGLKLRLYKLWQAEVHLQINNIFNESYVLMANHPMPGREWNLGFKIAYGLKGN